MAFALVIGGGPAGLMAATVLAERGHRVTIVDAMPSFGRKFLMAGKSGLNLTKNEPMDAFQDAYGPLSEVLTRALEAFGPKEVMAFAQSLGQEVFSGTSGRVFPTVMKASPMLRAWLLKLETLGVTFQRRWRWTGWKGKSALFDTPDGVQSLDADVTVLALGGASWSRLGSDGKWAAHFKDEMAEFQPANMGFLADWSEHMEKHFGTPVKGVELIAGDVASRGEFVISARGLEGGGIYAVSRAMREGAPLMLDLTPDLTEVEIAGRLASRRSKDSLSSALRKVLKLDPVKVALLNEFARPFGDDLASRIKRLEIKHNGPRPMEEAISTAGGIRFDAVDDKLMSRRRAGVFFAGEMLDWEAPTGGYLLTACFATGRMAGEAAADYAAASLALEGQ